MPVRSLPRLGVRKEHLKEVGITHTTLKRYKKAVNSFFVWRTNNNLEVALSYSCLDFQVGEYFNDLYRRFMPLHYAGDCLSGMKRLFPHTRKHLDTAGLYYKNWVKVTKRRKALPLSSELVRAMAAHAVGKGEVRFAVCLLLAFVGLLRTGEFRVAVAVSRCNNYCSHISGFCFDSSIASVPVVQPFGCCDINFYVAIG